MKKKVFSIILATVMVLAIPLCVNAYTPIISIAGLSVSQIQAGGNYEVSNDSGAYIINNSTITKFNGTKARNDSPMSCWDSIPYNSEFNGVRVFGGQTSGFYYLKSRQIDYSVYNTTSQTWTNSTIATIPNSWSTDLVFRMEYSSSLGGLVIQHRGTLYIYKNNSFQTLSSIPYSLPERTTLLAISNGLYIAGSGGLYLYDSNNSSNHWSAISSDNFCDTSLYSVVSDGNFCVYRIGGTQSNATSIVRYDLMSKLKSTYRLPSGMQAPLAGYAGSGSVVAVSGGTGYLIQDLTIPQS
jgi:hypothetical protein